MECYKVTLFAALTLIILCHICSANECTSRTTFVQIRIPQRTSVSVKYPKEIESVQFVPFPDCESGSECTKCQASKCQKCEYNSKSQTHSTFTPSKKTNIIVDIKSPKKIHDHKDIKNSKKSDKEIKIVDGAIVGIYDSTWAASKSEAKSKKNGGTGKSSAASASGTSVSQGAVVAAIDDEETSKSTGEKSHVKNIYAASEDDSTAKSKSTAKNDNDCKDCHHENKNVDTKPKTETTTVTKEKKDEVKVQSTEKKEDTHEHGDGEKATETKKESVDKSITAKDSTSKTVSKSTDAKPSA